MRESDYQRKIIKKYEKQGYFVLKLIRTNIVGISDLLILKSNETPIFLECKTEKGKLSEIQKYRLEELKKKGFDVFVSYGHEIKKV